MLAIIIPTLNAGKELPGLLAQIPEGKDLPELAVIVSDGGSIDDTLSCAAQHGAVICMGGAGRGAQLARGANWAAQNADITGYLFLHADCRLPVGWEATIQQALAAHPNRAYYFRFSPRQSGMRGWLLAQIVALRSWAWKLPYGDQGLLISRDLYGSIGGFDPNLPLFEDVEIVRRLVRDKGRGALRPLGRVFRRLPLKTDISRHLSEGVWRRGRRNYAFLRAYISGASVQDLRQRYK